jgi:hypothetical protein
LWNAQKAGRPAAVRYENGEVEVEKLLQRSAEYERLVIGMLSFPPYNNSARSRVSRAMCSVSIEHAESAKMLLAAGNFTSSLALLRVQYEALVRAIWVYYAASDTFVEKLSSDLSPASAKKADKLPMLSEMLKNMEGKAPKNALGPLIEFREYSWKPLSSYIHGGIHAIDRHSKGYPVALLKQTLKASNGVNGMTGYFLAILTCNSELATKFWQSFFEYKDCLPEYKPNVS